MSRNRWGVLLTLTLIFLAALFALSAIQPAQAAPNAKSAAVACTNLLINSDMESNAGWVFGDTPARAEYVTSRYTSPHRSILLGITNGINEHSYSSIQQLVNVPVGSSLRLLAHVYPMSQPYDSDDAQELIIMNSTGQPLRRMWADTSNVQVWQTLEFNLSDFMGMPISVYFNVFNDGAGGVSAMYIDDVTLEICYDGASSPTPAATTSTQPCSTSETPATPPVPETKWSGMVLMSSSETTELDREQRNTLLTVARQSIDHGLSHGRPLPVNPGDYPAPLQHLG